MQQSCAYTLLTEDIQDDCCHVGLADKVPSELSMQLCLHHVYNIQLYWSCLAICQGCEYSSCCCMSSWARRRAPSWFFCKCWVRLQLLLVLNGKLNMLYNCTNVRISWHAMQGHQMSFWWSDIILQSCWLPCCQWFQEWASNNVSDVCSHPAEVHDSSKSSQAHSCECTSEAHAIVHT